MACLSMPCGKCYAFHAGPVPSSETETLRPYSDCAKTMAFTSIFRYFPTASRVPLGVFRESFSYRIKRHCKLDSFANGVKFAREH